MFPCGTSEFDGHFVLDCFIDGGCMGFLNSLLRRKGPPTSPEPSKWLTYCALSLSERFDQLSHDQVIFLKTIRLSEGREQTLATLMKIATGESISPGVCFDAALLQILDALNAKSPNSPRNLEREFRQLMQFYMETTSQK